MPNATDLLREDHHKVKDLFRQFDEAETAAERRRIADQAIMELEIHSQIEEEIFYPAVRKQDDAGDLMDDTMNEADEEHHVADLLIGELKKMRSADARFVAKFTVLAENVKHHIGEEEAEIFTKAAEGGMDRLQKLGARMEARKAELVASYGKRRPATRGAKKASRPATAAKKTARTVAKATRAVKTTAKKATSAAKKTARKATKATKPARKKVAAAASSSTRKTAPATRRKAAAKRKTASRR